MVNKCQMFLRVGRPYFCSRLLQFSSLSLSKSLFSLFWILLNIFMLFYNLCNWFPFGQLLLPFLLPPPNPQICTRGKQMHYFPCQFQIFALVNAFPPFNCVLFLALSVVNWYLILQSMALFKLQRQSCNRLKTSWIGITTHPPPTVSKPVY